MAGVQAMAGFLGITIEELGASPYMLIGSVDSVCDDLYRLREEFGISNINIQDWGGGGTIFAPVVARMAGK
jgi:hypothetical protein